MAQAFGIRRVSRIITPRRSTRESGSGRRSSTASRADASAGSTVTNAGAAAFVTVLPADASGDCNSDYFVFQSKYTCLDFGR